MKGICLSSSCISRGIVTLIRKLGYFLIIAIKLSVLVSQIPLKRGTTVGSWVAAPKRPIGTASEFLFLCHISKCSKGILFFFLFCFFLFKKCQ